ncbi:unnamed protein product [Blepharisma stoltei]|uniref:Uncharacterized protein n=1 Tax=Blepharisma stoltei TaxID=1481888 RepID=A0AAU9IZR9_9CILI|nr:unnamed protein product [Blepharisma stoltei]
MNEVQDLGCRILAISIDVRESKIHIGTTLGFRAWDTNSSNAVFKYDLQKGINFPGGFSLICNVPNSNTTLLVASVLNQRQNPNTLYYWNEDSKGISDEKNFDYKILNILARYDKIVVICENIIFIYSYPDNQQLKLIRIEGNSYGACAISYEGEFILATTTQIGQIRIENIDSGEIRQNPMHENPIVYIALNSDSRMGASASEQGTLIRVFDCNSLAVLHELRRGNTPSRISTIAFGQSFVIAANTKNTVHLWDIDGDQSGSYFGIKNYLPSYFTNKPSSCKLYLPNDANWSCPFSKTNGPVIGIQNNECILIGSLSGVIYRCRYNRDNKAIEIESSATFLDLDTEFIIEGQRAWGNFS